MPSLLVLISPRKVSMRFLLAVFLINTWSLLAQPLDAIPGTSKLTMRDSLSEAMVSGIHRFLDRALAESVEKRQRHWNWDYSSAGAYLRSIEKNRARLQKIIGAVDKRLPASLEFFAVAPDSPLVAETAEYSVYQVRWQVLEGNWGEGLLLDPVLSSGISVVALPDADQTPEQLTGLDEGIPSSSQFARILAENGCQVLVPVLVNRSCQFSGNPDLGPIRSRMTNQPHREWLYRMAYQMGRHIIGYEVQKILAGIDWFENNGRQTIAVAGYGEGGLLALYAAAIDTRIDATLVSGYFQPREATYQQPIYRNVWSLLEQFGDAEIASLIFPRSLIIENSQMPQVLGPPEAIEGRYATAASGQIATPPVEAVHSEFARAQSIWNQLPAASRGRLELIPKEDRLDTFASRQSLESLLSALGSTASFRTTGRQPKDRRTNLDLQARQQRIVRQIEAAVQHLLKISNQLRDDFFLDQMPQESARQFARAADRYRMYFWEEVVGKVDQAMLPANPRSRLRYRNEKWTGYDVVLDVWEDVFAWGILLLPNDLKPGERRPVVVTQHGLEGLPQDVIESDAESFSSYRAFAAALADLGFIVFAPHNPYRGQDRFRQIQRKANPLKLSLFSFIVGQHRQILDWLKSLPFVDGERIGFYGLSYGGKTAMRVPAILEDYALSICSGDFDEWIWQNITVDWPGSYMFFGEYEIFEFDLGMTFNYAEMAFLIFPRPFMVERGHRDGNGIDEMVAYEYARVRRLYDELGLGDRTEIEYFNGGHEINGRASFEFLRRHLEWTKDD